MPLRLRPGSHGGRTRPRMPAFAAAHPSLHVTEIKITTILSDEAKNKQLDTVKCHTVSLPQAVGRVQRQKAQRRSQRESRSHYADDW